MRLFIFTTMISWSFNKIKEYILFNGLFRSIRVIFRTFTLADIFLKGCTDLINNPPRISIYLWKACFRCLSSFIWTNHVCSTNERLQCPPFPTHRSKWVPVWIEAIMCILSINSGFSPSLMNMTFKNGKVLFCSSS